MRLSIFGLGYVGITTAACLANEGHQVIGVDIDPSKVRALNEGNSPLIERDIDRLITESWKQGRLRATQDVKEAIAESDLAFVCVGTPSREDGRLNHDHVAKVLMEIGSALKENPGPFLIVVRSTVTPGTVRTRGIPILESRVGKPAGTGYDVVFHPEFLREGSAVEDFYSPPKIVIGERVSGAGAPLVELYKGSFDDAPIITCSLEVAEMVKYCDNIFHALKITFANEIGQFCQERGIDSHAVMEIFKKDKKLNISDKYLRPGFAFGGSCLPKDLRALVSEANNIELRMPMCEAILPSNDYHIQRTIDLIDSLEVSTVGMVGLAFKAGTDDLRESPYVSVAESLLAKDYRLQIYDPLVKPARFIGGNKAFISRHLPHLAELLIDDIECLGECQLIILGHPVEEDNVLNRWLESGTYILDLTGEHERERPFLRLV